MDWSRQTYQLASEISKPQFDCVFRIRILRGTGSFKRIFGLEKFKINLSEAEKWT